MEIQCVKMMSLVLMMLTIMLKIISEVLSVIYLKSLGMGHKHYYGGWYVSVREFGQSLTRKEAYAEAFAKVLSEVGMRCYVDSRMD